ncbi:MAG: glutaredoxin domain-containing protein [Mycoplasmoidaceae bacterium]
MYLIITKSNCLSCEKVREFFEKSGVKFREVNCSNDDLSIEDIEIMKTSPNNSLSIYLKRDYTRNREKISREELKDMFADFLKYGSFPIIVKYNFLNQLENYSIGFSEKIIQKWFDNESIIGQYVDINYAFKSRNCCYMCDRKTLIEKIESKEKLHINDSIDRLNIIKQESRNFVKKYTEVKKDKFDYENNDNEDDLIMANELPRYKTNSFSNNNEVFRKQSTSTLEIPINDYVVPEETQLEKDKSLINKFKDRFQKIGKTKIKKEDEFIVHHIKSSREESEIDDSIIFGKEDIFIQKNDLKIKNIKVKTDYIDLLEKEIDDMNNLVDEQKKHSELFEKEESYEEPEFKETEFDLEEIDLSKAESNLLKNDEVEIKHSNNDNFFGHDVTENFVRHSNEFDDEIDPDFRKTLIKEKYMIDDEDFESLYVDRDINNNE